MFAVSFLLKLASSKTQVDLVKPYNVAYDGKVNYWELGGAAIIIDDAVMMVPPIQTTRGSAWTNVQIPKEDFSIDYEFKVSEGTGGGGIGFWLTTDYMSSGTLCGSASVYDGFGLLCQIVKKDEKYLLNFFAKLNEGYEEFSLDELTDPDFVIETNETEHVRIRLKVEGDLIVISRNNITLTNVTKPSNIRELFIGVSASSDITTSRVDFYAIEFNVYDTGKYQKTRKVAAKQQTSKYNAGDLGVYRSPAFLLTREEATKREKGIKTEATADRLFDIIDELNKVSFDVASFKDVNKFVKSKLTQYAQKWQRRTLRLIERVRNSRDIMSSALNYSNELMEALNNTLTISYLKTANKVIDIERELFEDSDYGIDRYGEMEAIKESADISWIVYVSVAEVILIIIGFILVHIPSIRSKILE